MSTTVMKTVLVSISAAIFLLCTLCSAQSSELRHIFDIERIKSLKKAETSNPQAASCPSIVPPMRDMSKLFGFYTGDGTQSQIDKEAMTRYSARVYRTAQLNKVLLQLDDRYFAMPAQRRAIALCIVRQLRVWAQAGGLLGEIDDNDLMGHRQAILIGLWTSIAAANAFAIARTEPNLPVEDIEAIRRWFSQLADAFVAEFTPPATPRPEGFQWLDATANHSHWAAAAVGILAVQIGDAGKLDWALKELPRALAGASPDGSLPHELGRGGRALQYHSFAMTALGLVVALADANGKKPDAAQEAALERIANFTLRAFKDPTVLAAKTGREQIKATDLTSWMEIMRPHFSRTAPRLAGELDAAAAPFRPQRNELIGIDGAWFAGNP
jgi:hypothetical protein